MEIRLMRVDFFLGRELVARRPVAVAVLEPGERVSVAMRQAAEAYCEAHGPGDVCAWVCRIPKGAEEFAEVDLGAGKAILMIADWVPEGQVIIGRGGGAVRPPIDMGREMPCISFDGG